MRDEIIRWHADHAWQPFTQMKLAGEPFVVSRAEGVFLYDYNGNQIIDAVGSWWVAIHGHNHPYIKKSIQTQMEDLDHVMYAGFTHKAAAELSYRLSETTQHKLPRIFFSDNGSTAVEIALKMAFQFFANTDHKEKNKFVSLMKGYHGDTIGTMSAGSRSVFHDVFHPLLFDVILAKSPSCPFVDFYNEEKSAVHLQEAIEDLERIFYIHGPNLAAMILEPIIQGAGGMNYYPPLYLKKVRELCDRYDVFFIVDEVFTGCGRTGKFYAFQHSGIYPDIIAISKGLSAGYLPIAATLSTEKIYQGFYSDDRMHTLFHGHSMTANPPGCAASLASLDLIDQSYEMIKKLEEMHSSNLLGIKQGPASSLIQETRNIGTVAAIELKLQYSYTGNFAYEFMSLCKKDGVLLRPLGNVIYITPPYIIEKEELGKVYEVLERNVLKLLG